MRPLAFHLLMLLATMVYLTLYLIAPYRAQRLYNEHETHPIKPLLP